MLKPEANGPSHGPLAPDSASPEMQAIRREDYQCYAATLKHVFLTGDLKRAQPNSFFSDARLEVILCFYQAGDNGLPHWHAQVTEYELVLDGRLGYLDIGTGREQWFGAGDFLKRPAGVCVKRLVDGPCHTLALKVPSDASKIHCSACQRDCLHRLQPFCH